MVNIYYKKYLKYKNKYTYLKNNKSNMIGGNYIINNLNDIYVKLGCKSHKIKEETKKKFIDSGNKSTYGEITRDGLKNILKDIDTSGKIFYDLGSGLGKVTIYSITDHNFDKAYGIELAPERYYNSVKVIQSLPDNIKNKIKITNDSFLNPNINLSNADIVFISSLCFPMLIMKKLGVKLSNELKKGTVIFTSKKINIPKIKFLKIFKTKMTWNNNSKIYKYIKI